MKKTFKTIRFCCFSSISQLHIGSGCCNIHCFAEGVGVGGYAKQQIIGKQSCKIRGEQDFVGDGDLQSSVGKGAGT